MDKSVVVKHYGTVARYYPGMDITQLGLTALMVGVIRASMGHEASKGTVSEYIHPKHLSKEVRQCLDYLEREVLGLKRSRIDVDYWKRGNAGSFRRSEDKVEV